MVDIRKRFSNSRGFVMALCLLSAVFTGRVRAQDADLPTGEPPAPGRPAPSVPAPVPQQQPQQAVEPGAVPSQGAVTPTPTPLVFENVPIKTLWEQYRVAVKQLAKGEEAGVEAFARLLSSEDVKWLQANMPALVDLLSSGTIATSTPTEKNIFVLQALLRNMPRDIAGDPKFHRRPGSPYGVALVTDPSSAPPKTYVTLVYQEAGRWVLYHPFFARDFVWVPQLAYYKALRRLPNGPDEMAYLSQGFTPFIEWARGLYQHCGYLSSGETTRGNP